MLFHKVEDDIYVCREDEWIKIVAKKLNVIDKIYASPDEPFHIYSEPKFLRGNKYFYIFIHFNNESDGGLLCIKTIITNNNLQRVHSKISNMLDSFKIDTGKIKKLFQGINIG